MTSVKVNLVIIWNVVKKKCFCYFIWHAFQYSMLKYFAACSSTEVFKKYWKIRIGYKYQKSDWKINDREPKGKNTLGATSTCILVLIPFCDKRNEGSLEKRQILRIGAYKMSLEHLVIPGSVKKKTKKKNEDMPKGHSTQMKRAPKVQNWKFLKDKVILGL